MIIDFRHLAPQEAYHTITQTLIPRPVAWVLTENPDNGYNLAPYSFFTAVTSSPPLLMISAGRKPDGEAKDTRANIEQSRFFTVHIAHRELAAAMTETSRTLPRGESELERTGLELADFGDFQLPRLKDCRIAMGCELYEIQQIGDLDQSLIFGRILNMYVDDRAAFTDDKGRTRVDAAAIDPIGRLGGSEYVTFGDIIRIPRPA